MNDDQFEQLAHRILVAALGGLGVAACGGTEAQPSTPSGTIAEPTSVIVASSDPEPVGPAPEPAGPAATSSADPKLPHGPERLPEKTPQGARCTDDDQFNLVAELNPAHAMDYISLRRIEGHRRSGAEPIASVGAMCSGAQDVEACQQAVAATKIVDGFRRECIPGFCAHSLLYTRGDTIGTASSVEALTEFLGAIDTEGEAYLLAWSQQYNVESCSELPKRLKKTAGGYLLTATKRTNDCPIEITQFNLKINTSGAIKVLGSKVISKNGPCAGRRPAGFVLAECAMDEAVGEYLATSAQLEQASVAAFEQMQSELTSFGAPQSLIHDAARAAEDERRHTQSMTRLAARYHAVPVMARVAEPAPRDVYAIALENAVEGCVRETFGALVGMYQARAAGDAELRAAMADIAQDELRHAALSWRVAAWLEPQLSAAQRLAIAAARSAVVAELSTDCAHEPEPSLQRRAGLPPANVARQLVAELQRTLWADASA